MLYVFNVFKAFVDNEKYKITTLLFITLFFPFIFVQLLFVFSIDISVHSLFPHRPIRFLHREKMDWLFLTFPSSSSLSLSSLSSHPLLLASSGQSLRLVQSSSCCSVFLWLADLLTLPKIRGNTGSAPRSLLLSLSRKKKKIPSRYSIN